MPVDPQDLQFLLGYNLPVTVEICQLKLLDFLTHIGLAGTAH
jgi:hypothetical protein